MASSLLPMGTGICLFCQYKSAVGTWSPAINNTVWTCERCSDFWSSHFLSHAISNEASFTDPSTGDLGGVVLGLRSGNIMTSPEYKDPYQPPLVVSGSSRWPHGAEDPSFNPLYHQFSYDDRLRQELFNSDGTINTVSSPAATAPATGSLARYMRPSNLMLQLSYNDLDMLAMPVNGSQQQMSSHTGTQATVTSLNTSRRSDALGLLSQAFDHINKEGLSTSQSQMWSDQHQCSPSCAPETSALAAMRANPVRQTRARRFQSNEALWKYVFLRKYGVCDHCRAKRLSCSPRHLSREVLLTVPQETWDECPRAEWLVDLS